jgi:manganese transport protein
MELAERSTLSDRTDRAARAAIRGEKRGIGAMLPFIGPAVIASIAYMDPGNFATNIEAGSSFGYQLLWVVLTANLIAMLFQALSAKLGIATGESLASLCRLHLPWPLVIAMWIASEIAAIATDIAEFTGGALGLSLLLHIPLMGGLVLTGVVTWIGLMLQGRGFRPIEIFIGAFVGTIGLAYVIELVLAPPNWALFAYHSVVPHIADGHAATLAVGIVGATVMPHAIYLHSSLTRMRIPTGNVEERRRILSFSNREVVIALSVAGLVNMAMLAMAATVFHGGHSDVAEIETAYKTLTPILGSGAAIVFIVSLIASGISSSIVGTMAGQTIMQDFVHFRIPLWLRRVVTMAPSFLIVGLGVDTTNALVVSQVVLSLILPVPMIALLYLIRRTDIMGVFATRGFVFWLSVAAALIVLILNAFLLLGLIGFDLFGGGTA